jgi:phage gp46-like protein
MTALELMSWQQCHCSAGNAGEVLWLLLRAKLTKRISHCQQV